uniref:RRM domain-containing protein n=1 Tax=viral metagenome TaxID=1070528 RepID=A0A6C0KJX2_9ZZZZ
MEFNTNTASMNSLYIPVLPTDMVLQGKRLFDEESMKEFFEKMNWGKVSRVDYVSKPMTNNNTRVSAFIHFEELYSTGKLHMCCLADGELQEVKIDGYNDSRNRHFIYSTSNPRLKRYFAVRINKTPIKEVKVPDLNIHQLIASNEFMEKLIEQQKTRIAELEGELSNYKSTFDECTPMTIDELATTYCDDGVNEITAGIKNLFLRETSLMN